MNLLIIKVLLFQFVSYTPDIGIILFGFGLFCYKYKVPNVKAKKFMFWGIFIFLIYNLSLFLLISSIRLRG